MLLRLQCRAGVGACPDTLDSSGKCTNDVTDVSGSVTDGKQCVSFVKHFSTCKSDNCKSDVLYHYHIFVMHIVRSHLYHMHETDKEWLHVKDSELGPEDNLLIHKSPILTSSLKYVCYSFNIIKMHQLVTLYMACPVCKLLACYMYAHCS